MIYYITGGERSGKSSQAQQIALSLSPTPVYLATARKWDHDFEKRITRHQEERDLRWLNIEEEKFLSRPDLTDKVVVLDCITLWLANIYADCKGDTEASLHFAKTELAKAFAKTCTWIIVSNEIGMGLHASTETGRKFVELQGWVNQHIAQQAQHAFFMVSGIPLQLKHPQH